MRITLSRKTLTMAAIPAIAALALLAALRMESVQVKKLDALRATASELERLDQQYMELKALSEEIDRRAALSPKEGVSKAVEDVFSSVGLRGRLASIKPLGLVEEGGLVLEEAEVTVKKAGMNEAINILYAIERAPMMLSVRRLEMRAAFGSPALDMKLVVALARRK